MVDTISREEYHQQKAKLEQEVKERRTVMRQSEELQEQSENLQSPMKNYRRNRKNAIVNGDLFRNPTTTGMNIELQDQKNQSSVRVRRRIKPTRLEYLPGNYEP